MDWTTQIRAGKGSVSVHFSGGALTAYGVTPAKFSTSSPFFQHVIESSDHFKSGRIALLGEMEVPDDAATRAKNERIAARKAAAEAEVRKAAAEAEAHTDDGTVHGLRVNPLQTASPEDASDEADSHAADSVSPGFSHKQVEVADKYDAIEYLKEHFPEKNYTSTSLRTKTAFEAACHECGVAFVFTS